MIVLNQPAEISALRQQSYRMLADISFWCMQNKLNEIQHSLKAGFNPDQPRDYHGRWSGGAGSGAGEDPQANDGNQNYPDSIEPVYPIESLAGGAYGRGVYATVRGAVGFINSIRSASSARFTAHGGSRSTQRTISSKEINIAMRTASKLGRTTSKMGKYNTPQVHYEGSNGITVIVEQSGRNAGKIITVFRR